MTTTEKVLAKLKLSEEKEKAVLDSTPRDTSNRVVAAEAGIYHLYAAMLL